MTVPNVPAGYHTVTPYLVVHNVPGLIEFLGQAFDATVTERMTAPDGGVAHAAVRIGDSMVMMGEARDMPVRPAMLLLYVPDADAMYRRALLAGATSVREVADQFYGDRTGGVKDSFGNEWWVATHKEDVSPQEMQRRMAAMQKTTA
jgi:PhnB protein